jgi:Periplasmic copper-binding protein (NosD)
MASKIQIRRGLKQDLPLLDSGEFGFVQDFQEVFIGGGLENIQLAKQKKLDSLGVDPSNFGLDESALDNYQALIDTFTFISVMQNGKGKIIFPQGKTFRFTRLLGVQTLPNVFIDLNGSRLDFSGVAASSTDSWLQFSGSIGTPVALTSNAAEGSKTVACNTTTFQKGDMVKVYSNKVWDSTRTSTRVGEICFVETVNSASQLTLTTPLQDTYNLSDVANIVKITPVEIMIENGTIIGPAGDNEARGLRITRGKNCLIQNLRTEGFDVNQIQLTDCVRSTVDNCYFQEANHSSMAYGVSFADASQDCIASNNHFTDIRHSLSTNNNVTTSWGIVRRILFTGNTVTDSSPAIGGAGGDAIDTHGGADDIFIIDNTVFSSSGVGINVEANRATIRGNRVKGSGSVGIQWQPYGDGRKSKIQINDNILTGVGDGVGSDYGILCQVRVADCESVIINSNEIDSQNGGIRLVASNGYKFKRGAITGNGCKVNVAGYGIDINNSELIAVNGNTVDSLNFGIGFTDSANCSATGNTVELKGLSSTGYGIRLTGTTKRSSAVGNTVKMSGTLPTSYGVSCSDTATYNMLANNVTEGCTSATSLGAGTGNVAANNI